MICVCLQSIQLYVEWCLYDILGLVGFFCCIGFGVIMCAESGYILCGIGVVVELFASVKLI